MESNLKVIKTLTETLISELNLLEVREEISSENSRFNLDEKVQEFEIKLIIDALSRTDGHQSRAADLLGLPTSTLHSKIKVYGIQYKKTKKLDS